MTSMKPGSQVVEDDIDEENPVAEARILPNERAGQSNAPADAVRSHTLVIFVHERPGSLDRVIGLLRRRRANMQTLIIGRSEQPDVARVTAVTDDSEVSIEQLARQLLKVVDVRQVIYLSSEQMVERELALVKVTSDPEHVYEIIELSQQFGAHVADVASDSITLEVTASTARVEELLSLLQPFGVREVARTGSVALPRGTTYSRA